MPNIGYDYVAKLNIYHNFITTMTSLHATFIIVVMQSGNQSPHYWPTVSEIISKAIPHSALSIINSLPLSIFSIIKSILSIIVSNLSIIESVPHFQNFSSVGSIRCVWTAVKRATIDCLKTHVITDRRKMTASRAVNSPLVSTNYSAAATRESFANIATNPGHGECITSHGYSGTPWITASQSIKSYPDEKKTCHFIPLNPTTQSINSHPDGEKNT